MSEMNGHIGESPPASPGLRTMMAHFLTRAGLSSYLGWMFGGERRIHQLMGYKPRLTYEDVKARFMRQDIAHRLLTAYPKATWAQAPEVKEDDSLAEDTAFEAAWKTLVKRVPVFEVLQRADILANLGRYSVILLGLRNQPELAQPARRVMSPEDVLYLTPYSEEFAKVQTFDTNPASPTFGRPLLYSFNFARSVPAGAMAPPPTHSGVVHASRVVHLVEECLDDEVYGVVQLEKVYDRLDDLAKIVWGGAEMFFLDGKRRFAMSLRDGYQLTDDDKKAMVEQAEAYRTGFQDFLRLSGMDITQLVGQIPSPKDHFDTEIALIAGAFEIPVRILLGAERGELASSQDERNWLQNVQRRQQHQGDRHLRSFQQACITLGILPEPQQDYENVWPNLWALTEEQQAEVAQRRSTALAQYAGPGMGQIVMPVREYREQVLGLPPEPDEGLLDPMEPDEDLQPDEEQG